MIDAALWVAFGGAVVAALWTVIFAMSFIFDWHIRRAVVAFLMSLMSAFAAWRNRQ